MIVEEYQGGGRRRVIARFSAEEAAKILAWLAERSVYSLEELRRLWCGGWDLNPRRPTPAGPQPAPFDLARAPPHRFGLLRVVNWGVAGRGVYVAYGL